MYRLQIALRYIFSKKKTNAINIITWVSMTGMGVGAFALVLVLSVFNGFEHLVTSLYNSFYPSLEITATNGKFFYVSDTLTKKLSTHPAIENYTQVFEENAYIQFADKDYLAKVKGVDENFEKVTDVKGTVHEGVFLLKKDNHKYAVIGANIAAALSINTDRILEPLVINIPRQGNATAFRQEDAFYSSSVIPSGVFSIQQEFDSKYIFVSLDFMEQLLDEPGLRSGIEIKLKPNTDAEAVKKQLASNIDKTFRIKTKYEQKETLYKIMRMERWAVFAILSFIMIIVSFNIIGSLFMVVIEKRKDIAILKSIGATPRDIQLIFALEGMLTAVLGALVGILTAVIVCLLQMKFGFVKLGGSGATFVVEAYPVALKASDIFLTLLTVIFISFLAAYFPARSAARSEINFQR
jgi:lipoprotein-releasing system permease protein